jgi:hypothetical protein
MRKFTVAAFMSLDGVIQAPGGPEEDTSDGFRFGGWTTRKRRPSLWRTRPSRLAVC